jgi:hypothetical protein
MILSGVEAYKAMDPLFECVRVVLAQRGEKLSSDYVQGISGAAFRIAGPCPCAPTCSAAMGTAELVRLLGYEAQELSLRHLPPYGEAADPAGEIRKVVDRVKDEVRAGRAVIVWNAFTTAEWDVVCGFDDATHQFLGRGSYAGPDKYASADEGRLAKGLGICPAAGAILVGRKSGDLDAKAAELAALAEAVRHAHSPRDRFLLAPGGGPIP